MSATDTPRVFRSGGPNGAAVWWPAGLQAMTPRERVEALARGWWHDGDAIITRDGRCLTGAAQLPFVNEEARQTRKPCAVCGANLLPTERRYCDWTNDWICVDEDSCLIRAGTESEGH